MKVHPFARGFWDNHPTHDSQSLTLCCKRFRPLAPKGNNNDHNNNNNNNNNVVYSSSSTNSSFDLSTFIRPESGPRKLPDLKKDSPSNQVESNSHPGGTRWNPTQEQIGILEMLYKGGMRTPNAQQIEQITEQLSKYGKIEGKNVFYWFQNHKARERQKQKRTILGLCHNPRTPPPSVNTSITLTLDTRGEIEDNLQMSPYKRKFRSWTLECSEENTKKNYSDEDDKTLELFPLRPEGFI